MSHLKEVFAGQDGEGYIDMAVLIPCVVLVLALSVKILPVLIVKQQLDTLVIEPCREVETAGRIGSETSRRAAILKEKIRLNPEIHWSASGRIRLSEEITVQLTCHYNPGLFGGSGSSPIVLRATATGESEVHWR